MGEIIRRHGGYSLRFYEGGRRRVLASKQTHYAAAKRMLLEIEARVAEIDGRNGGVVLRRMFGRGSAQGAAELRQAFELGIPIEGQVSGVVKGGVEVQVSGNRAFCPISQLENRHVEDAAIYVGQRLQFKITRFEEGGRSLNLVLSRRTLLEAEAREKAVQLRKKLAVGAVLRGKVTSIKDYGAFVDLGGIEGLLHVSELGHGRVAHPQDVVAVDDQYGGRRRQPPLRLDVGDPAHQERRAEADRQVPRQGPDERDILLGVVRVAVPSMEGEAAPRVTIRAGDRPQLVGEPVLRVEELAGPEERVRLVQRLESRRGRRP